MANFLNHLENPQINHERFYEIMRDFRKGGLNPSMYSDFLDTIKSLPPIRQRTPFHYMAFNKFELSDITSDDFRVIMKEFRRRAIEENKTCWHPNANPTNCQVDESGKIIITKAHSIQNNGILSQIAENNNVTSYAFRNGELTGEDLTKSVASIFWGFCNTHDRIFEPIERQSYIKSPEQHFLLAYRGFVVAAHKKREGSYILNFDEQSEKDIVENKKIFDKAILENNFSVIESEVFELPYFYPIAASSSFYLDFDFEGKPIPHSDERMENIYITLLPNLKENKTYFIISYLEIDKHLYENLGKQLRQRNNLKSDITMIVGAHAENVYFNPIYFKTFIEKIGADLHELMRQTQFDHGHVGPNNEIEIDFSMTPNNYLKNPNKISFFGY